MKPVLEGGLICEVSKEKHGAVVVVIDKCPINIDPRNLKSGSFWKRIVNNPDKPWPETKWQLPLAGVRL